MAKTNFTKVEEVLTEGLLKIERDRLLQIADETSGKTKIESKDILEQKTLFKTIKYHLKYLKKLKINPFEKSTYNKKEIKDLLKIETLLEEKDFKKLQSFNDSLETYKKQEEPMKKEALDEALIEQMRLKQINKRFNINENWLPLT